MLKKIVIGFVIFALTFVFNFWLFAPKEKVIEEVEKVARGTNEETKEEKNNVSVKQENEKVFDGNIDVLEELEKEEEIVLPDKAEIENVPFLTQSPFAKWDDLHNEACEEAALIMAKYWLKGKDLNKEIGDKEILDSVAWQEQNWGGHYDLNAEYIKKLGIDYFNLQKIYYTKIDNINDIKKEISKGNLVIVPTAGRLLDNP